MIYYYYNRRREKEMGSGDGMPKTQGLPKVEQVLEVRSSDSKMKERGNMFSY